MDAVFDLALARLEAIVQSGAILTEIQKRQFARELRDRIIAEADAVRIMGDVRAHDEIAAAAARALDQQAAVRDCLARNDLSQGLAEADRFLERYGIQLPPDGIQRRLLARDLLVAMQGAFGVVARQECGDFPDIDQSPLPPAVPQPLSDGIRTPEQLQQDRALASSSFSKQAESLRDTKTANGEWDWDQNNDFAAACRLFIEFVGDKPIIQYGPEDAKKFILVLQRMPVGVNQRKPYLGLSASQAIEKADQIQAQQTKTAKAAIAAKKLKGAKADRLLKEAHVRRISTTTVLKHRNHVAAVFSHPQSGLHVAVKNPFHKVGPTVSFSPVRSGHAAAATLCALPFMRIGDDPLSAGGDGCKRHEQVHSDVRPRAGARTAQEQTVVEAEAAEIEPMSANRSSKWMSRCPTPQRSTAGVAYWRGFRTWLALAAYA